MNYTLNLKGQLFSLGQPVVMGILNVTPDSFYADSRQQTEEQIAQRTRQIISEGAAIIDVGACSTRPGSAPVSQQEEIDRLRMALPIIRKIQEETDLAPLHSDLSALHSSLSIDTFRPDVARMAVEEFGADIINDVSEGNEQMFRMTARLGTPYVLTSVQPDLRSTLLTFARKVQQMRDLGQKDIILDPGFGFGKTVDENFQLLSQMDKLSVLELPLLVGISRKSMIWKTLQCTPDEALGGTTALNAVALMKGASILRVHDVKAAVETCQLLERLKPLNA
ncbi:MAG: dihydropteroate synthase [Prevotella sp.]|nr:dihydropteroate synthase [Prevotella sp.]